jgi:hypothetical protein
VSDLRITFAHFLQQLNFMPWTTCSQVPHVSVRPTRQPSFCACSTFVLRCTTITDVSDTSMCRNFQQSRGCVWSVGSSTLSMGAVYYSEKLVHIYQTTRCHNIVTRISVVETPTSHSLYAFSKPLCPVVQQNGSSNLRDTSYSKKRM